ncbi:MAG: class I SAM-dependent methyltransferase [Alphaproteobacteria bacterium]
MAADPSGPAHYTRTDPSPRYRELVRMYRALHDNGDPATGLPPSEIFAGYAMLRHMPMIAAAMRRVGARSVLDYGSGKGALYHHDQDRLRDTDGTPVDLRRLWGVHEIALYDPAYPPFDVWPQERFDAAICVDVMEHVPEEDVDWTIDDMFRAAARLVLVVVAGYPAIKLLPNGENPHVTLRSAGWWTDRFIAGRRRSHSDASLMLVVRPSLEEREVVVQIAGAEAREPVRNVDIAP